MENMLNERQTVVEGEILCKLSIPFVNEKCSVIPPFN